LSLSRLARLVSSIGDTSNRPAQMIVSRPARCRSALLRALLDWNQRELSDASGVKIGTVKDFESGQHQLGAKGLTAIVKAFQAAGLELLYDGQDGKGPGVRIKEASE
jgi:hypothetical protein